MIAFRAAVVSAIKARVPSVAVEEHGGRFDAAELKRVAVRAPAVFVAVLGVGDVRELGGEIGAALNMGAFVITTSASSAPRDEAALAIVQALLGLVPGNRWGRAEGNPDRITAENLFSSTIDKRGVAMWAVSWRQRTTITDFDAAIASLDDFLRCDVQYPSGDGAPVAEDLITLQGADNG